ncbi:WG repeat-containing protein [Achromobacter arsenitoxydans]|uniref:KWG Leptospira family protein 1 n=1 Tax=Achromobacter arsenitoxydans SY8 TaxID=477184 RepID=H0F0P3_9BURK|nr:WG repeat-containing protein [Achromobacter arsenitoxydans]EHK68150.1 KWG Leptospira family protein 1 [Achromobacter arsenitoxydans SY8]
MKAAPFFKPLALAAALAGLPLLAPVSAHAMPDWMQQCTSSFYGEGSGTSCHENYQEGLAAVLVGVGSDESAAWGYIDKQGIMAIAPAYTEARSFQNGVAAVSQGDRWGYIDRKGQWVIQPRFSNATGFNAEGTALAEEDGRDVLIDRHGKVVKTFPLGTRSWGFLPGQKLASMEWPTPPRLFSTASGKAAALPDGVMALAAPTGGYLPAQTRDSRYGGWWGLLDAKEGWAIAPQTLRSMSPPVRDGNVVAVQRERQWEFVDTDGASLAPDRYERVELVAPGAWLARSADGRTTLLDGSLKPIHVFQGGYVGLVERDGWRYATEPGMTLLVDPAGGLQRLPLRNGKVEISGGRAWVYGAPESGVNAGTADDMSPEDEARAAAALAEVQAQAAADEGPGIEQEAATEAVAAAADTAADAAVAAAADAAAPAAMDAQTGPDDAARDAAVAQSGDGALHQIYGPDGRPVLDDAAIASLRGYDISIFHYARAAGADAANAPLALLHPDSYEKPLGILTASGKIVTNADWDSIDTYDVAMPLLVRTKNHRAGAIGADGSWAVPPEFSEMRAFRGPYTWARTPDMKRGDARLIDARGQTVPVPADVLEDASKIDGDLLFYRKMNENRQRRWGLWNIREGAPALKPAYEQVQEFEGDWAKVQEKNRWGVVNRQGQWVLPATQEGAYDMEYLGDGLMLVDAPDAARKRSGYSERAYRVVNLRTGKSSEPVVGKPEKLKGGRLLGQLPDASVVLFDAQGSFIRVSDGRPESKQQYGDWLYIRHDEREGAIDARGNLKVPAIYGEFNPFFAQPEGLARANLGSGYRVIDQNGKPVLEKLGDGTPLASMRSIVFSDDNESTSIMVDLQGREIARVAGRYAIDYRNASEGVAPYSDDNGKSGFINAAGKRVVGAHFDKLGPLKDGLARARRLERTGKLYGYVDLTGRYAIAPAFTWAADFHDERALVRRGRLVEFIDTKGKTTALFGTLCGTLVIVDAQDRQSWPPRKLTCPEAVGIDPPPPVPAVSANPANAKAE